MVRLPRALDAKQQPVQVRLDLGEPSLLVALAGRAGVDLGHDPDGPAASTVQWLRDGAAIAGATGDMAVITEQQITYQNNSV